jgi:putative ABC transport system ATP-binding protein
MIAAQTVSGSHGAAGLEGIAVACRNVTKTYHSRATDTLALRGVNLEVRMGELMLLVGPSGCGKTTLISIIAGILDHDGGDCIVFDRDYRAMRGRERIAWRGANIGFVFQSFNLIPTLTTTENVAIPLLLNHVPGRAAYARAAEALITVGLQEKLRKLPAELSGGQQQRVAIARAMVHEPRLIVCDEPTSALDHETGHHIMELLRQKTLGPDRSLLIVTHDARIFEFADRIARMDDGRIESIEQNTSYRHAETQK